MSRSTFGSRQPRKVSGVPFLYKVVVAREWLDWVMQIQAIAQTGRHYAHDKFDIERYEALHKIVVEMMSAYTNSDPDLIADLFHMDQGHATPKVDVRGVVFRGDELLLVKERATGKWTLPGGFADIGESPSEAVAREVREESGYQVRPSRLLALYDRSKHDHPPIWFACYKVFIECQLIGGQPTESLDTDGAAFFRYDSLPELCVGRISLDQIERVWKLRDCPTRGAEFD